MPGVPNFDEAFVELNRRDGGEFEGGYGESSRGCSRCSREHIMERLRGEDGFRQRSGFSNHRR
jgi:hypothetical protein